MWRNYLQKSKTLLSLCLFSSESQHAEIRCQKRKKKCKKSFVCCTKLCSVRADTTTTHTHTVESLIGNEQKSTLIFLLQIVGPEISVPIRLDSHPSCSFPIILNRSPGTFILLFPWTGKKPRTGRCESESESESETHREAGKKKTGLGRKQHNVGNGVHVSLLPFSSIC